MLRNFALLLFLVTCSIVPAARGQVLAASAAETRERILNQYLSLHPIVKWDCDWTTAIFVYGAASSSRVAPNKPGEKSDLSLLRAGLKGASLRSPREITSPDLAALSLPAIVLLDRMTPTEPASDHAQLQAIIAATKTYFKTEPLNAGGVFDHVGYRHRFKDWLPPTQWLMPSSVWADSAVMYGLNGYLIAKSEKSAADQDFFTEQLMRIHKILWNEADHLYKHAYFFDSKTFAPANSFWARGNTWMALAHLEMLSKMSPQESHYAELRSNLQLHVDALTSQLDHERGLKTLLSSDLSSNYYESSASALLAFVMMKGARLGLLRPELRAEGEALARALSTRYLKDTGNDRISVTNISCPTTATTIDRYYVNVVGLCPDESYGVGIFLMMLGEL